MRYHLIVRRALRSSRWRPTEVVDARWVNPPNLVTHVSVRAVGLPGPRLFEAMNLPPPRGRPELVAGGMVETAGDLARRYAVMRLAPDGDVLLLRRPSRRSERRYEAAAGPDGRGPRRTSNRGRRQRLVGGR